MQYRKTARRQICPHFGKWTMKLWTFSHKVRNAGKHRLLAAIATRRLILHDKAAAAV